MITETEIFARMDALHSALVEKLGARFFMEPFLRVSYWSCRLGVHGESRSCGETGDTLYVAKGDTIDACLADAEAFVASMPDRDAKAKADWHRKLGDVIDEGHALALPDEVMAPLRQGSWAMTENLLAGPTETEGAPV
jgi:hypothetical protein